MQEKLNPEIGVRCKKLKCFFAGDEDHFKPINSITNHTMMTAFTNAITDAAQRQLADIVQRLAKHYGFNYIEAMRMLGDDAKPIKNGTPVKSKAVKVPSPVKEATPELTVESPAPVPEPAPEPAAEPVVEKPKKKPAKKSAAKKEEKPKYVKPKHAFPWTGKVVETWCKGLRPNGGMLSQCTMAPKSEGFCTTCFKQFKNDGKTKCGTVQDRIAADEAGKDFKNPETGKTAVSFGVFIAKQKIDRDAAITEAAKFGIEIPETHFEVPQKRKGRPPSEKPLTKGEMALNDAIKKAVAAVTSSSESEEEPEPVMKTSTPVPESPMPDLVDPSEPHPDYDAETEDEDDEPIDVVIFTHKETKYLRDKTTNMIYDEKTQELVGVYDEAKDIIQPCEEVETEDEADN